MIIQWILCHLGHIYEVQYDPYSGRESEKENGCKFAMNKNYVKIIKVLFYYIA